MDKQMETFQKGYGGIKSNISGGNQLMGAHMYKKRYNLEQFVS